LEEVFKKITNEIDQLRANCESLANQVGKELILEQKLEIHNKVIKDLKENIANTGKFRKLNEKLLFEKRNLESEMKLKMLEDVLTENKMLEEKLENLEKAELLDRTVNISLEQEPKLARNL
jgi:hypothetical protein